MALLPIGSSRHDPSSFFAICVARSTLDENKILPVTTMFYITSLVSFNVLSTNLSCSADVIEIEREARLIYSDH